MFSSFSVLETFKATDIDLGKNAEIEYSITSGNIGDKFQISAVNGKISWNIFFSFVLGLTFGAHAKEPPIILAMIRDFHQRNEGGGRRIFWS